jgi:hypothetical protein
MKNLLIMGLCVLGCSSVAHAGATQERCMDSVNLWNQGGQLFYTIGIGPQGADFNPISATGLIRDFLIIAADEALENGQLQSAKANNSACGYGGSAHKTVCIVGTEGPSGPFIVTKAYLQ